jgi:uncharacterized protein YbaA (DUF1428 family)
MPRYVDGFVIPIPRKNVAAYRRMARAAGKVWMELGALSYVETIGDDLNIKGMGPSFPKGLSLGKTETVAFSFIVYKSRAHRDRVNAAIMKDPRLQKMMAKGTPMPFDVKRMLYGGFATIVDL